MDFEHKKLRFQVIVGCNLCHRIGEIFLHQLIIRKIQLHALDVAERQKIFGDVSADTLENLFLKGGDHTAVLSDTDDFLRLYLTEHGIGDSQKCFAAFRLLGLNTVDRLKGNLNPVFFNRFIQQILNPDNPPHDTDILSGMILGFRPDDQAAVDGEKGGKFIIGGGILWTVDSRDGTHALNHLLADQNRFADDRADGTGDLLRIPRMVVQIVINKENEMSHGIIEDAGVGGTVLQPVRNLPVQFALLFVI